MTYAIETDWWEVIRRCPSCGRFLAESSIHSEDYADPDAWYGVSSRTWADCAKCGRGEPRYEPGRRHTETEWLP